jgi:hypothetical protein
MTFGRHLYFKNLQDSQPAHVEEEDKMAQPQQSTGEERTKGDQVVLSGRDNNSTKQSEYTVKKTSILVSCLPVTTTVKKLPDK